MKKIEYKDLPLATRAAVYVALRKMQRTTGWYEGSGSKTAKEWMEFVKVFGTWSDDIEVELFGLLFAED